MNESEFESKLAINKKMIEAYTKLEEGYTILSEIPLIPLDSRNGLRREADLFSELKAEYEKLLVNLVWTESINNGSGE